jgi:hypothetical protein
MLTRLFTGHPATVGETYFGHLRQALGFSIRMFAAALACFVHALLPFLFVRTGSSCIETLHQRMVVNRARRGAAGAGAGAGAVAVKSAG